MTLFFNIESLEKVAKGDSRLFMQTLYINHLGNTIPRNKRSIKIKSNLTGFSFLLNPAPIFTFSGVDINYFVQYVKLAALRDYTLYKLHNYAGLDLSFFPDINRNNIKHNPLIKIVDNHIYFKYEEQYLHSKQKKD